MNAKEELADSVADAVFALLIHLGVHKQSTSANEKLAQAINEYVNY